MVATVVETVLGWLVSEEAANLGSLIGGAATAAAVLFALGAWGEWEQKRARDRRADVATRVIRRAAVISEELSGAICAPGSHLMLAQLTEKQGGPLSDIIRAKFEQRMRSALEHVREFYMLRVEALVHLDQPGEVEAVSRFMHACHKCEQDARVALVWAEDDVSAAAVQRRLRAELVAIDQRNMDAREDLVHVLTPVARNGRPGRTDARPEPHVAVVELPPFPEEQELEEELERRREDRLS
jgi:hypothetical protein